MKHGIVTWSRMLQIMYRIMVVQPLIITPIATVMKFTDRAGASERRIIKLDSVATLAILLWAIDQCTGKLANGQCWSQVHNDYIHRAERERYTRVITELELLSVIKAVANGEIQTPYDHPVPLEVHNADKA